MKTERAEMLADLHRDPGLLEVDYEDWEEVSTSEFRHSSGARVCVTGATGTRWIAFPSDDPGALRGKRATVRYFHSPSGAIRALEDGYTHTM